MTLEAPTSKFKKNNLIIFMVACIAFAMWFTYDGYFNENFIKKYTNDDGSYQETLVINRRAPYFLGAGAALLAVYYWWIKDKKIIADEKELIVSTNKKIDYNSIRKIDKTHFESKGFFIITYNDESGNECSLKLSDRRHDDLGPILELMVSKIS
ncbi:MAG: hypothetical protein ACYSSI_04830 [Planctomycetota bacterium]|jgi:hypothetical protein